ncbi:ABC transporter substrate binding protein [Paenibacillus sp. FSL K6-2524]|uniref:ABC transporter substrate binding protein n=1 Tax=Paenibacillus sp. FSL K6-2524 TaxID=2954516 RepID=UPI0030FB97EC
MGQERIYLRISKVWIAVLLIVIGLSLTIYLPEAANAKQTSTQNVLILNSYHKGYTWTDDQNNSIEAKLKGAETTPVIFSEYMDWKRYPTDANIQNFYEMIKVKYAKIHIDVIIVTDDSALNFAMRYRKEILNEAPIVFSGINRVGLESIIDQKDITGVIEEIDPTETIRMSLEINPSIKNIYVVYDNTESGISTGKLVAEKISSLDPGLNFIPMNALSNEEIMQKVSQLGSDSIILLTTYYSDSTGQIIEFDGFASEISSTSSVPVYGLYEYALNHGVIGGDLVSGINQGHTAGDMALQILQGTAPEDIPIASNNLNRRVFDFNELQRFHISINKLPSDSEIINKPFSFYETYRGLVLSIIGVFVVLLAFIAVLVFYVIRDKRMRRKLQVSYEELEITYEELTALQDELQEQYNKLVNNQVLLQTSEEKYRHLAYNDVLSGLPNRLSLTEELRTFIEQRSDDQAALFFLDIDDFKYINDTKGHPFGDQLLVKVGERLQGLADGSSSIFRLGGDEFVILLQETTMFAEVMAYAESIVEYFKEPFLLNESLVYISASIGIARYPKNGLNAEELMKNADIAMYKAKETGKGTFVIFGEALQQHFDERMIIENQLRNVIANDELSLHYQPLIDLGTGENWGFEALIRWNSPVLGFVSPLSFIKIAEDSRLIVPIGEWVLRESCGFIKGLQEQGYKNYHISVNISVVQLMMDDFTDMVLKILRDTGLSPQYLELEITESIFMESFEEISKKLEFLKHKGIGIALDDFGTGYSSLSYLTQLPITTLKIDKSFIDGIDAADNRSLASSIITMGHDMGLYVTAEGVETAEQLAFLERTKCDKIQGYFISRPIPGHEVVDWVKERVG